MNPLPRFQYLERSGASVPALEHLGSEIGAALSGLAFRPDELRGKTIAVTVGSRGIASLKEIARAVCEWLKTQGAHPFVFPAMGSHGGATAEGQRKLLEGYGVTPEFIGAPIRASMETVSGGRAAEGFPVIVDRLAWEADAIVVMNRIKPHTAFFGAVESGLLKMIAVGMSKAEGAREFHRAARRHGHEKVIRAIAAQVLASGKILCGLAVVENELHQICAARAARPEGPEGIVALDESSLAQARQLVPRLPFPRIDLLMVDEMGKNISGTGMDTKVIGRGVQLPPGAAPEISLVYARDLTSESDGNALGIGLTDFIHERLRAKIDFEKMYVNARTSTSHYLVRLPMVLRSDREALDFALDALGTPEPAVQRMARIRSTQSLDRLAISERLAADANGLSGWQLNPQSFQLEFDGAGNLPSAL